MGRDLFDRFADWTREADAILGYSVSDLCLEDTDGRLGQTEFTQPALFVVNAMTWRARREGDRPAPTFVAGHSLGEYSALVAAGALKFADAVRVVRERGRLMQNRHSMAPMRKEHETIRRLAAEYTKLYRALGDHRPSVGQAVAFRRGVFRLYAPLKIHLVEEEIYIPVAGEGRIVVDGDEVPLEPGVFVLVQPASTRQVAAGRDVDEGVFAA